MDNPRTQAIGKANPPLRLTQEETFRLVGYNNPRILKIFLYNGIDFRRFYLDPENFNRFETPDERNLRYLQGAMHTDCRAVNACMESAGMTHETSTCSWCARARAMCALIWEAGSVGTCDFAASLCTHWTKSYGTETTAR